MSKELLLRFTATSQTKTTAYRIGGKIGFNMFSIDSGMQPRGEEIQHWEPQRLICF